MTSKALQDPGNTGIDRATPFPVEHDLSGSAIIDLDGAIQSVNSDFTTLLGYGRTDLAHMRWADCGHPDDVDAESALIADMLVGARRSARIGKRFIAKDGAVLHGDLRLSPLCDRQNTPISLFAEFTVAPPAAAEQEPVVTSNGGSPVFDVDTARRPAMAAGDREEDGGPGQRREGASAGAKPTATSADGTAGPGRATALKAALESRRDEPTTELMSLLNHEFRTPLNAIIGFAEMLDHEMFGALGNARYRQYAQHIQESGNRLLEFISEMLDLLVQDKGGVHHSETAMDPPAPDGARPDGPAGDRAPQPAAEPRLLADPRVLTRILSFLVSDAIRGCKDGDQVTVTVDETAADGGLTYTIEDLSGDGLQPGPFGRPTPAKDGSRIGTGLGLPLCQWLVRLHGGDLKVERRPGAGTKVRVRLPENRMPRQAGPRDADQAD